MLSVLIPVYQTDVRTFVRQLIDQLEQVQVEAEIICLDDASGLEWKMLNREMQGWKYVRYEELELNIGRSRIRNLLAQKAKHEWLIFADGDSRIEQGDFIQRYLQQATNRSRLVYGGTSYGTAPAEKEKYLHWLYGSQRECISADQRNKNRFGTFKTNNFMVSAWLFGQVKFNETVKGYGHEDTLFAQDLERKSFDILHIENPLLHNGLETNVDFIAKQQNAIANLAILYKKGLVGNEIRLIRFYNTLKKRKLLWLVRLAYLKSEDRLMRNLLSEQPRLGSLDRLKLSRFMAILKKPD